MKNQYEQSRNRKLALEVAIAGFVLATMFYNLDGAVQRCSVLDTVAWVAHELLHLAVSELANL